MASKSMTGAGVTVTIGGSTVGELKTVQLSGQKWSVDDITNAASPTAGSGVIREVTNTILDPGQLNLAGVWVYNDAGQQALNTAFANGSTVAVVVTLLKGEGQATTGSSFSFSGIVTDPAYPDISFDKALTWKATVQITTAITVAYGS